MKDLIERIERAEGPGRELFILAWEAVRGEAVGVAASDERWPHFFRFMQMINCGAWESAALTLLPEGWEWALYGATASTQPEAQLETEAIRANPLFEPVSGIAATPALALLAAIRKARSQSHD